MGGNVQAISTIPACISLCMNYICVCVFDYWDFLVYMYLCYAMCASDYMHSFLLSIFLSASLPPFSPSSLLSYSLFPPPPSLTHTLSFHLVLPGPPSLPCRYVFHSQGTQPRDPEVLVRPACPESVLRMALRELLPVIQTLQDSTVHVRSAYQYVYRARTKTGSSEYF